VAGPAATLELWWAARWSEREGLAALLEAFAALAEGLGALPPGQLVDLRPRALSALPLLPLTAFADPWGEGKPVPPDDERAPGLAPELLFGCRREAPEAAHLWGLGLCLLGLLRLAEVGRGAPLPPLGVDTPSLRPLRVTLITDVHRKKPGVFAGRKLPPNDFLYPEALPEGDQAAVERALGLLREGGVAVDPAPVIELLGSLLKVAPAARGPSLGALPAALRAAAAACRRAGPAEASGARAPGPPGLPVAGGAELARVGERLRALEAEVGALATRGPDAAAPQTTDPRIDALAADLRVLQARVAAWVDRGPAPVALSPAPARAGADRVARGGLALLLVLQLGVGGALLRRDPAPAAAPVRVEASPPAAPVSGLGRVDPSPAPAARPAPPPAPASAPADPPAAPDPSAEPSTEPRRAGAERRPEPKPVEVEPAPAPAPSAAPGRLRVRGGTATLSGPGGPVDPGAVPPGSYSLRARTSDGKDFDLGTVTMAPGGLISVACGFGRCARD
jgi:hypothetical protein